MIHKINNNNIYISVDTDGAELCSLCDVHGLEYIWQNTDGSWAGHSPVLFPIVGAQKDYQYIYDGVTYPLPNHGFALNSKFKVVEKLSDVLRLRLRENSETLKQYPFKFTFDVSFELSNDSLYIRYTVTNNDEKVMPFSVGGHTGYPVPLEEDEKFEDYRLKFDFAETCQAPVLTRGMTAEAEEYMPLLDNTQYIDLTHELFSRGVLVLENLKSRGVELYSKNSGRGVRVDFEGFDNLGLWQNPNGGNYICIEPWSSPGTHSHPSGLLEKRKGMTLLKPQETAEFGYKITII